MGETYWKLQTMANYFHPNTSFSSGLWEACLWINYKKGKISLLFLELVYAFILGLIHRLATVGTVKLPILPLRLCTIWDLRRICKVHQHLLRIFYRGRILQKQNILKQRNIPDHIILRRQLYYFPSKALLMSFFYSWSPGY